MVAYITLPGIFGSGKAHWQTLWEEADPAFGRFQPTSWERPDLNDWLAALDRAVDAANEPPLLVAHSLSCLLVAHWAAKPKRPPVAGAFLVSVPDPKGPHFPIDAARSFIDAPDNELSFPALIVASTDDPYGSIDYARRRAASWRAGLVIVGADGHLNESSGLGDWPLGAMLLQAFRSGLRI